MAPPVMPSAMPRKRRISTQCNDQRRHPQHGNQEAFKAPPSRPTIKRRQHRGRGNRPVEILRQRAEGNGGKPHHGAN